MRLRATLVLTLCAVPAVVFMLQGWLSMPWIGKVADMSRLGSAATVAGSLFLKE